MRILAKTISYLFHPMFMSIVGVILILNMDLFIHYSSPQSLRFVLLIVSLATFLLPLSLVPFYLHQKIIDSIEMEDKKERFIPLLVTSFIYYMTYLVMKKLMITEIILAFVMASASIVFVISVLTNYFKVSIHMTGLGGIFGLLIYLSVTFHLNILNYLAIVIIISGVTGMARLMLNSHKPYEVYAGWGIGAVLVFFIMRIYLGA